MKKILKKDYSIINNVTMKNVIRPAVRECNYFIKNNEFKNFDNLNNRARHFTIKLIKKRCLEKKITKHDYIIKWYEEYFNKPKAERNKGRKTQ